MAARRRPRAPARTKAKVTLRTRTAYHEAGHVVLSTALAAIPEHVSIRASGNTLGRSAARLSAHVMARAQIHLAGFAAEQLLTGRRARQLDQELGFAIIARHDAELLASFSGEGNFDGHRAATEVLSTCGSVTDDELRALVDRTYDVARESLGVVWSVVRAVAAALLAREELDRGDIEDIIGGVDVCTPVLAVQRAHGFSFREPTPAARKRTRRNVSSA